MADPPSDPAVKWINNSPLPGVTERFVGEEGAVAIGIAVIDPLEVPEPIAFTALNWKVYCVPFVKPEITIGDVLSTGLQLVNVPPFIAYS